MENTTNIDRGSIAMGCYAAVQSAQRLGIYAVPIGEAPNIVWKLRMANGCDADLGWLIANEPRSIIGCGWPTWDAAINAWAERQR